MASMAKIVMEHFGSSTVQVEGIIMSKFAYRGLCVYTDKLQQRELLVILSLNMA